MTSTKYQGKNVSEVFPELYQYSLTFNSNETDVLVGCRFSRSTKRGEPGTCSEAARTGIRVIDLSGAYRLADTEVFENFYKLKHTYPELLKEAVFGLPEFFSSRFQQQDLFRIPDVIPHAHCSEFCRLLKCLVS
ncbi:MAG: hypothetical protein CM1200mP30_32370 [Pseudomonadota bacterium]|nr:MAG: hypothetical protein CM1200mP30_32370 [Pseudomonadota bacterium]